MVRSGRKIKNRLSVKISPRNRPKGRHFRLFQHRFRVSSVKLGSPKKNCSIDINKKVDSYRNRLLRTLHLETTSRNGFSQTRLMELAMVARCFSVVFQLAFRRVIFIIFTIKLFSLINFFTRA